jgi:hypothetical protein
MWFQQTIRMDIKGDAIDLFWANTAEHAMRDLGVSQHCQVNRQHSHIPSIISLSLSLHQLFCMILDVELELICQEMFSIYFYVLSQFLSPGIEEEHGMDVKKSGRDLFCNIITT